VKLDERGQPSETSAGEKMTNDPAMMENGWWAQRQGRRTPGGGVEQVPAVDAGQNRLVFEYVTRGEQRVAERLLT